MDRRITCPPKRRLPRRWVLGFLGFFGFLCFLTPEGTQAASSLTYRHKHFVYTVAVPSSWRSRVEEWTYDGQSVEPASQWRVDGDDIPPLPAGVQRTQRSSWNRGAIGATIERLIAAPLRRRAGEVSIRRDEKGLVRFDGVGLTGREVDVEKAIDLTLAAMNAGVSDIDLPVTETQPRIRVEDPELIAQGIAEVVTIGESEYAGSPVNRKHNIGVGLDRFNGHLIKPGETFSFNAVLGNVDARTGYRKELVIKGDRTEPDYGGGLCQISTTAYRGIWEYGFPIVRRRNHSYTVRYYFPPGTDATVYPGAADLVFKNDLPSSLLIQTHREHDRAYFIFYGTRDKRQADVLGPFIFDRSGPPPDRIEYTTDLPPGVQKKLNERVPGLKALWYRFVRTESGTLLEEKIYSAYEARPLFTAVGVEKLPETSSSSVSSTESSSAP